MVSIPGYDPNEVPENLKQLNQDEDAPLFNRATQGVSSPDRR